MFLYNLESCNISASENKCHEITCQKYKHIGQVVLKWFSFEVFKMRENARKMK